MSIKRIVGGPGMDIYFAKITVDGPVRGHVPSPKKINLKFNFANANNRISRIFILSPEGRVVKSYKGANRRDPLFTLDTKEDVIKCKQFSYCENITFVAKMKGPYIVKYWIKGPGNGFYNIRKIEF